jgi:hypothetical protein
MDWSDVDWVEVYKVGTHAVPAVGYAVDSTQAEVLSGPVRAILADVDGQQDTRLLVESLVRTDFHRSLIEEILTTSGAVEEWRAGEALAEHHLGDLAKCTFPWPGSRDLKNPGTSGGGVDLIGFNVSEPDKAAFALAEVKTSRQLAYPPTVMTGRHGLEAQLEGLRDHDKRKTWAIKYIGHHAQNKPWVHLYMQAMDRYLGDIHDVRLYGTLVHLTEPDDRDLRARAINLTADSPASIRIELSAIYVSAENLSKIAGGTIEWETADGS